MNSNLRMKKRAFLILPSLCLLILIFSCNHEDIIAEEPPHDSIQPYVDSSQLSHNLVWNGHYYQLEFDTAYATFEQYEYVWRSTEGNGPSKLVFMSIYNDAYSDTRIKISVHIGWVSWSEINHEIYIPIEAQEELDKAEINLTHPYTNYAGIRILSNEGVNLLEDQLNLSFEVLNFQTYNDSSGRWAIFNLVIEANNMSLNLNGKLRAQDQ